MLVWLRELQRIVESTSTTGRIALVGMGHPLRSDDYVGSYIVKRVTSKLKRDSLNRVFLFDGEDNVENFITGIARLKPAHVIFIDACEMRENPGATRLLSVTETSYPFFTTHGVPLKLLAQQLLPDSSVWILAIQPERTDFGEGLSAQIRSLANSIVNLLVQVLRNGGQ